LDLHWFKAFFKEALKDISAPNKIAKPIAGKVAAYWKVYEATLRYKNNQKVIL
jgi:hypothetical protein